MGLKLDGFSGQLLNVGSGANIDNIFSGGGTIHTWLKRHSTANGDVMGKLGGGDGWFLFIEGDELTLRVMFDGNMGAWSCNTDLAPIDNWENIIITYNSDSPANDPSFYIDDALRTHTEDSTPSGSYRSDAAQVGTVGGTFGRASFRGELESVRWFDHVISAGERATLAAGAWWPIGDEELFLKLDNDFTKENGIAQLMSHYRLEEDAGADRVDSHGSNDLYAVNNPPRVNGKQGYGVDLEAGSNQNLRINTCPAALRNTVNFSYGAWVNPESTGGTYAIMNPRGSTAKYHSFLITVGKISFGYRDDDSAESVIQSVSSVSAGNWYFPLGSRDIPGGMSVLYFNGAREATDISALGVTNFDGLDTGWRIGERSSDGSRDFDGIVDEASVWVGAVSEALANWLYNGGSGRPWSEWGGGAALDEDDYDDKYLCSENVFQDSSASAYNGTPWHQPKWVKDNAPLPKGASQVVWIM